MGGGCITCRTGANTAGGARPHLRHVERVRTARARDATLDVHRGRGVDVVARRLGAVEDGPRALVVVRLRARCAGGQKGSWVLGWRTAAAPGTALTCPAQYMSAP